MHSTDGTPIKPMNSNWISKSCCSILAVVESSDHSLVIVRRVQTKVRRIRNFHCDLWGPAPVPAVLTTNSGYNLGSIETSLNVCLKEILIFILASCICYESKQWFLNLCKLYFGLDLSLLSQRVKNHTAFHGKIRLYYCSVGWEIFCNTIDLFPRVMSDHKLVKANILISFRLFLSEWNPWNNYQWRRHYIHNCAVIAALGWPLAAVALSCVGSESKGMLRPVKIRHKSEPFILLIISLYSSASTR